MKNPVSIKQRLTQFIIYCWFIPMEALFLFLFFTYRNAYIERTDRMIHEAVSSSAMLFYNRVDELIRMVEKPSYEQKWERGWNQCRRGEITKNGYYSIVRSSLRKVYMDSRFDTYAYYTYDGEQNELVGYSSQMTSYPYSRYQTIIQPVVDRVMEKDSNYTEVHVIDGQIYLIRNLYTITGYERYGTLVLSLNTKELIKGFSMQLPDNVVVGVNGTTELFYMGRPDQNKGAQEMYQKLMEYFKPDAVGRVLLLKDFGYQGYLYQQKLDKYSIGLYYVFPDNMVSSGMNSKFWLILAATGILVLITLYALHFLKVNIQEPVNRMVEASRSVEAGNIGACVEGSLMPNQEFAYLASSFNDMSQQVKNLFDSVYAEQLAKRDAQIAALQAQINPHFLNNTLEMMNWQARMNNDIETCKMIESLSIVLDHSINRSNEKTIYLSEELRCADAYLYIMSMRFGQRLLVEKQIDEELLRNRVPQLILQPLIENAIVHGIETVKHGTIWLSVHHDDALIYLDVINTGRPMEEKEVERVSRILDGTYTPEPGSSGKHISIGIRNVNRRIKLVYGEEYGLSIVPMEDGRTISRIKMPFS